MQQVKDACAANGLVFTIWMSRPFDAGLVRAACLNSKADGVILEGEIPGWVNEAVNWPSVISAIEDIPIAKSVVTNFAPFVTETGLPDRSKSQPLIDAGYACLTECYLAENQNATPENTDWYARVHLGWASTQPVLGVYGGKTLADYPTRNNYANWSVWDAGEVL